MNKRTREVTSILLATSLIFSQGVLREQKIDSLLPEKVKIEGPKEVKKLKRK